MRRINRPEMMDEAPDSRELAEDLRNLERINRYLGGRSLIRREVDAALAPGTHAARGRAVRGLWLILDVATGGADLPRDLVERLRRRGVHALFLAADRSEAILKVARARSRHVTEMRFLRCDARRLPFPEASVDLVLCSLALHHFSEEDAVAVLCELGRVTRHALIVNDLRRSPTACGLIWLITRFSRNRLTRYDSPLSVRRAFTPGEMRALACAAGLRGARVVRRPFFRQAILYSREK